MSLQQDSMLHRPKDVIHPCACRYLVPSPWPQEESQAPQQDQGDTLDSVFF